MTEHLKSSLSKDTKRTKALELQRQLFNFSGLPSEHIKSGDLFINDKEFIHYTEIDVTPKSNNNTLVLLHGYGGSNNNFFRMVKYLSKDFHIVALDLPGMALSSRVDTGPIFKDTKSCTDYFVDRLGIFFEKAGLDKFHLAGHSIGSYLATHYFDQHSDKVLKLIMLSPAGFNPYYEDYHEQINQRVNKLPFIKRHWINHIRNSIFTQKKSVMDLLWYPWRRYLIRTYFGHPRFRFSPEELQLLIEFHCSIYSLPSSGDRCLGYLLEKSVKSQLPSIDILEKHRDRASDMIIMYGDKDFMDTEDTYKELQSKNLNIRVDKIENSDHQIINQNPKQVCDIITEFVTKAVNG